MSRRHLVGAAIAVCSALLVTSCSTTLQGKAVSVFDDPFSVAGMPATDGPTGLRSDPAEPTRDVEGGDGGESDELARQAVSDIEEFWDVAYEETFEDGFRPVAELISWDANGFDGEFCGMDTYGLVNAGFCHNDRTIGWDRGEMLPDLRTGQRRHGRHVGSRARIRPRRSAPGRVGQEGDADAGIRAASGLLCRGVHAVGRRRQLAALHDVHRRGPEQRARGAARATGSAVERGRSRGGGGRTRFGVRTRFSVPVRLHRRRGSVCVDRHAGDRSAPR